MRPDRIFRGKSTFPGHEEWFYRTREGIAGPYLSRDDAAFALQRFLKYCRENGFDGGRDVPARRGFPRMLARLAKGLVKLADALDAGKRRVRSQGPSA